MPGIGVLTNPRSRKNKRNPKLARHLAYTLGDAGELAQPRTEEDLEDVARNFKSQGIDVLCINGGDGTAHVALTAFARVYGDDPLPKIALLRGGTMNTVAHGLKIKGTPAALLANVVRMYHEREPFAIKHRNLLCVDGNRYGFLFGCGFVPRWLEVYYEREEPSPSWAAWLCLKTFFSLLIRPEGKFSRRIAPWVDYDIQLDGKSVWPTDPMIGLVAGTVDDIGFGIRPFWGIPTHPGYLHAVGLGCKPLDVVLAMPTFYRGQSSENPDIHDGLCRELRISSDEPMTYIIDGDYHQAGQTLTLTVGPQVEMIVN